MGITEEGVFDALRQWDDDVGDWQYTVTGMGQWFFRVCKESDDPMLAHYLGRCYQMGVGLPNGERSDIEQAAMVYHKSGKFGNAISTQWLKEMNPKHVFFTLKTKGFVEIGMTCFDDVAKAYALSRDDRIRYRSIAQHSQRFVLPVLKDAVLEVKEYNFDGEEFSLCGTLCRTLSAVCSDCKSDQGNLFDDDTFCRGENSKGARLIVAKYHDEIEFNADVWVAGNFDQKKLTLCSEEYYDCGDIPSQLEAGGGGVLLLRCMQYMDSAIEIRHTAPAFGREPLAITSALFTVSDNDWSYDVFSDKEHIRRFEIELEGPSVGMNQLCMPTASLKALTKYDFSKCEDLNVGYWHSFSGALLLDCARIKVSDTFTGEVVYNGGLAHCNLDEMQDEWLGMLPKFGSGSDQVECCGMTLLVNRRDSYKRSLTVCYDGDFDPLMITIPWFVLPMRSDHDRTRIVTPDIMEIKMGGRVFAHSEDDEKQIMDTIEVFSWIQHKDGREPWDVLKLQDIRSMQGNHTSKD